MTQPGGDIQDLLRALGVEALQHEAESHGLGIRGIRLRCPWQGCADKGANARLNAVILKQGGKPAIYCHACGTSGDYVDLLQRTRGWSAAEAFAHVRGQPVPSRAPPQLRVVGSRPPDEEGKLAPADVQRIWDGLQRDDAQGREYLRGRWLEDAVDAGLVRFALDGPNEQKATRGLARGSYRVGALLKDINGQARGIQLRRITPVENLSQPKVLSVKGSSTGRAFFGAPESVGDAVVVAVAEGIADTLAVSLWAGSAATVVGAPGKDALPKFAEELESAGVDVAGKFFVLFQQNDTHKKSQIKFNALRKLLEARRAICVTVPTPDIHEDVAKWWQQQPDMVWPPKAVTDFWEAQPGGDGEPKWVRAEGTALAMRSQYTTERYAQNLSTLAALFDEPASRLSIFHTDEALTWNQMTHGAEVGGRPLVEQDITNIRLSIEVFTRASDGKPLQFKERDIEKMVGMISSRQPVHPIKQMVEGFPAWDGKPRLEVELPKLLGHDDYSFEALLLRRWFVGAVARALDPGCQMDTVLILSGEQEAGKTKFFRTLGQQFYTASKVQPGDVDGMLVMRKNWIIEWGELHSMTSRSREATKDFITQTVDTFRAPYGRDVIDERRHCVIVGTTNDKEILDDPTGNRRYWPVELCTRNIDIAWLRANRDQLFAEAVALYGARATCPECLADPDDACGAHRHWLMPEEKQQLKVHQADWEKAPHPWFDVLAEWIEQVNPTSLTTARILEYGLKQNVGDFKPMSSNQVAELMHRLGWKKARERTANGNLGPRFWVRERNLV